MKKERFALDNRTLSRDRGIALVNSNELGAQADLECGATAPLHRLLSTIGYQLSTVGASGQTLAPVRRLPLNEPLETSKNMPPAPPRKIETSPRVILQFGVFTSYQANVDASGNNILGDAANEPAIAVDPTDSNKMTIGWRQFDSINPTSGKAAGVIRPMPV